MNEGKEGRRTSVFSNGLIWFGAAVSIAEILTGTYIAPLGMARGAAAVLAGHVIGCVLLFFAGYIGAASRRSAMETVKFSFGAWGGRFFALLNVLQLVGWTGIMVYDGAISAGGIFGGARQVWAAAIGVLIVLWLLLGVARLRNVSAVAMGALFLLTVVLSIVVFSGGVPAASAAAPGALSFGAAVELSAAMPISWLPLISDYTKDAERPLAATAASAAVYGAVSCWMYIIGMGAAVFTAEGGIAAILVKAGLGAAGLAVIVLSTVTTTFLDAFSAGMSAETAFPNVSGRRAAVAAAAVGTACAMLFPMDDITDFLYVIGSVFAPMISILIANWFVLKSDSSARRIDVLNCCVWLAGFAVYRIFMRFDFAVGSTLPSMAAAFALCIAAGAVRQKLRGSGGAA
ncbi:MAG: putative hydroxymethylpyrimidine transporter CytX [Treponemataceae bacterium]|nr:putative hydroxymethylpyrimidine transporter CytX [Treponemataceae bacterium]